MFTGLIQSKGKISTIRPMKSGLVLTVDFVSRTPVKKGDSIAINGTCLTVTAKPAKNRFNFEVSRETLAVTNLGKVGVGSTVNIESSLRWGDALGGHFVTGHVDCQGQVKKIKTLNKFREVYIEFPAKYRKWILQKGSICINGVSLTVVNVSKNILKVVLIPETLNRTNLSHLTVKAKVNLEFDYLAKICTEAMQSHA